MKLDLLQFLFLKVDERWLMEGIVDTGRMKIGLPGLASLYLSASPSFGAVLGIYRNRSVGRLPLLPYTAMVCNSVIWMFYGVTSKQFAVAAPNLLGLVLGLVYCGVYCWHAPTDADLASQTWIAPPGCRCRSDVVSVLQQVAWDSGDEVAWRGRVWSDHRHVCWAAGVDTNCAELQEHEEPPFRFHVRHDSELRTVDVLRHGLSRPSDFHG